MEEPLSGYGSVKSGSLVGEILNELTRVPFQVFLNVRYVVEGTWLGYLELV